MFGFWGGLVLLLLFLIDLFRFGLGGSLGGFLLLLLLVVSAFFLGSLVLDGFVDEAQFVHHSGINRLVVNGLIPTCHVGVFGTPFFIEEVLEAAAQEAGGEEVG